MSRKQFKLIASALTGITDVEERKQVAGDIAVVLAMVNSRFDKAKFFAAAGVL